MSDPEHDLLWAHLSEVLPVGRVVAGRVVGHRPFGIFVDINLPFPGLVQITDFKDESAMNPNEYPGVGTLVEATVLGFKDTGRQVWLGMKPSQLSLASRHRFR
jgi:ribosomal protein S1